MSRPSLVLTILATLAVSACSYPQTFKAQLSSAQEVPPNNSPGTGAATVTYYPSSKAMTYEVTYKDLTGPAAAAHFHGPAAPGANAPVMIPMDVKPSPIKGGHVMTDKEEDALESGKMYVNIHTADNKNGEIRGQLQRMQ